MPKVRVVQMMGGGKPGGAELFFVRLMQSLAKYTDNIDFLPIVKRGGWAAGRLEALGIDHEEVAFGGFFDFAGRARVRRLVADFKPDVVMSWMNRATRFVPQGRWATCARLGGYYDLKYYRGRVEHLVGNTSDIATYCVRQGWDQAKVRCIGNFIPAPAEGWRAQRGAMRSGLGIPAGARVLLMAARLHSVKGYDTALRALATLPEDVWLLGVGEGPERDSLEKLSAELGVSGRVRFPGWAEDVSLMAAAADMWLVPSRHEPLGNSVLDAWAHGLPVVASRVSGPAGLIADGKDGILVAPDDATMLADAVRALLANPNHAAALAAAGQMTLERTYGEKRIVGEYLAYYQTLAAARS